ncbi:MAG: DUF4256 domain-containing protein [bacterium]
MAIESKRKLTTEQNKKILAILESRFEKNMNRHKSIKWEKVLEKLEDNAEKLWTVNEMEVTGGEPDVVGEDKKTSEFIFMDCSSETPEARRNFCYDHEALNSRKEFKPKNSAMNMATSIGVDILTEDEYRGLQKLGEFDLKTSSWLKTPESIRKLGGSIFGDRRYDTVFVYHNGAQSYYGSRGFRGLIRV